VTRQRFGRPGFDSRQDRISLFATTSRQALRPILPPTLWYRVSFLGLKRPKREANSSPLSSDVVNNAWRYNPTPTIRLHIVLITGTTNARIDWRKPRRLVETAENQTTDVLNTKRSPSHSNVTFRLCVSSMRTCHSRKKKN
jgi:hypothetical protein